MSEQALYRLLRFFISCLKPSKPFPKAGARSRRCPPFYQMSHSARSFAYMRAYDGLLPQTPLCAFPCFTAQEKCRGAPVKSCPPRLRACKRAQSFHVPWPAMTAARRAPLQRLFTRRIKFVQNYEKTLAFRFRLCQNTFTLSKNKSTII